MFGRVTICSPRISPLIHGYFFSVSTTARATKIRYVGLTPYCFWNSGLSLSRISTTRDMSTSIALVTCADVSSERRMCSAIPRRIAVIGSSCSPGAAATGCGRRRRLRRRLGCGSRGGLGLRRWSLSGAGAGSGAAAGAGAGASAGGAAGGTRLDELEDVLLRHSSPAARAGDARDVDAVLGRDARDDRRDEALRILLAVRRRGGRLRRRSGSGSGRQPAPESRRSTAPGLRAAA